MMPSENTIRESDDDFMIARNHFTGHMKKVNQFWIKGQDQKDGTRKDTFYKDHYAFVINKATYDFHSNYAGYYGLAPNREYSSDKSWEWNVLYEMKSKNQITDMVFALHTCAKMGNNMWLEAGGWQMKDFVHQDHNMDHASHPIEKIDTVDSKSWQILLLSAKFNSEYFFNVNE